MAKGKTTSMTICGRRIKLDDWVRVHYTTGRQGWVEGKIVELWGPETDGHFQARVSSGWCFHDHDEILELRATPTKGETE